MASRPTKRGAPSPATRRSLVRVPQEAEERSPSERQLSALLERLSELTETSETLSESLRQFRDERRARLGSVEEELYAAKRLEERVERLRAEAEQWAKGERAAERPGKAEGPRRSARSKAPPPSPPRASGSPPEQPWLALKELYRLLARKLHPDYAKSDRDRARRSALMSRANAAYARGDRVLLELLHAETLSPAEPNEATREQRDSHATRRLATLSPMVASLEKDVGRIRSSSQWKDLEACTEKAQKGRDYFTEEVDRAREGARAAVGKALERATFVADAALFRQRSTPPVSAAGESDRGVAGGVPWSVPPLLRKAVLAPARQRMTADAKRLEAELRRSAAREPWQAVLSAFAFFGEASAEPPPGLASLSVAGERYEHLRAELPAAPPFERAIVRLPPFLEIGLRAYPKRLGFGIQVKRGELLAGVRAALSSAELAPFSRAALGVMGPLERCARCGRTVYLVHVLRTRGIDEVHGLLCPRCAAVARSYRSLGAPEGLEALAPYAVRLGAVHEQAVRLADATLVFELLPGERRHLTAKDLVARLDTLHFAAISPELSPHVRLRQGRTLLAPSARVRAGATVRAVLTDGAPSSEKELLRALRARASFREK